MLTARLDPNWDDINSRRCKSNPVIPQIFEKDFLVKHDVEIFPYSQKKVNGLNKVSIVSNGCVVAFYKHTGHVAVYIVDRGTKKMRESDLCWQSNQPDVTQICFPYLAMAYSKPEGSSVLKIFKYGGFSKGMKIERKILYIFAQKSGIIILTQNYIYKINNYNIPKIEGKINISKQLQDKKLSDLSAVKDNLALIVSHHKRDFFLLDINTGKWISQVIMFGNHLLTIDFNDKYVVTVCMGDIFYYNIETKELRILETDEIKPSSLLLRKDTHLLVGFLDGTIVEYDLDTDGSKIVLVKGSDLKEKSLNLKNCVYKMFILDESQIVTFKQSSACIYEIVEGIAIIKSTLEWEGKGSNFVIFNQDSKDYVYNKFDGETSSPEFERKEELLLDRDTRRSFYRLSMDQRRDPEISKGLSNSSSLFLDTPTLPVINFKITFYDGAEQIWIWKPLQWMNAKLTSGSPPKTRRRVTKHLTGYLHTPNDSNIKYSLNKLRGFEKQEKLIKNINQVDSFDFNTHPEMSFNAEIDCLHIRRLRVTPTYICRCNPLSLEDDLEECQLEDVFTNDTLYYYLELYLKEKHAEELLYFVVDVEDYRTCFYEDHTILERCAKALINLWIGHEITFTENYTHLPEQKPSLNMFDDIQMEALHLLRLRWSDFRRWFISKRSVLEDHITKEKIKSKKISTVQVQSIQNRFKHLFEDETLYKLFHQYLRSRNSSHLLYFYECHKYFRKHFNYLSSDQIMQEAEKIVSVFFLGGDWKTKIFVEDHNLFGTLLKGLLSKNIIVLNVLDQISTITVKNLKVLYWNFCYELKSKHHKAYLIKEYLNRSKEKSASLVEFTKSPIIKIQFALYDKIYALYNKDNKKPNMINHFKELKQSAKLLNKYLPVLKYLKDHDIKRFKYMYKHKIYCDIMFNGIYELIQQNLIMCFVDVE